MRRFFRELKGKLLGITHLNMFLQTHVSCMKTILIHVVMHVIVHDNYIFLFFKCIFCHNLATSLDLYALLIKRCIKVSLNDLYKSNLGGLSTCVSKFLEHTLKRFAMHSRYTFDQFKHFLK